MSSNTPQGDPKLIAAPATGETFTAMATDSVSIEQVSRLQAAVDAGHAAIIAATPAVPTKAEVMRMDVLVESNLNAMETLAFALLTREGAPLLAARYVSEFTDMLSDHDRWADYPAMTEYVKKRSEIAGRRWELRRCVRSAIRARRSAEAVEGSK